MTTFRTDKAVAEDLLDGLVKKGFVVQEQGSLSLRNRNEVAMGGSYLPILILCAMLAFPLCGGDQVFTWEHLCRRIGKRFDVLSEHLKRHAAECSVRKGFLFASYLPSDPERKGNGMSHRSFRASYPGLLPMLRGWVPEITLARETPYMLIRMNSNDREITNKILIPIGSLHTTRYRLKRKMPPGGIKGMGEWVRIIE